MAGERFTSEVSDRLRYYVYRLIDPRSGETFYVGKGTGNRVFAHINDELAATDDDALTDKLRKIREIRRDGFEVAHVIHRHGMDQSTAYEVEAALIDAYPAVTNQVDGHGSGERGLMHARQIIELYEAETVAFAHRILIININRSAEDGVSTYDAVRYAWKLDRRKAARAEFVLAAHRGLIVDAFVADEWLDATVENFPHTTEARPGRIGFIGRRAPEDVLRQYVRKRVPDALRQRGAANPVRYTF